MADRFSIIKCEGVNVASSLETNGGEDYPVYYGANILFYVQRGYFNLDIDGRLHQIDESSFVLVKKYTSGRCHKPKLANNEYSKTMGFAFNDDFIRNIIHEFKNPKSVVDSSSKVLRIDRNPILVGLFQSLTTYIEQEKEINKELVQLKTREALIGILDYYPEYISVFNEFSTPERADLYLFMLHNFQFNLSLDELARMSGRSLSTFNREFRRIFHTTPHKWIMEQRLERAKEQISRHGRKPSEIYLELGFEDLSHFSRSFKKRFGVSPRQATNA